METINAVGRRKNAVARVFLKKGKGTITVNGKDYKEYFAAKHLLHNVTDPLETVNMANDFDVVVNATGGGIKGQAEAVKMGISRCLVKMNEELKPALKAKGFLTRDSRMVERKKFGLHGARRATQFSKR
ncbi:MAG: 30S ribosomal protein S9 [Chitinophagales bacterium]|jgi:small subunit ribosomal protein S9|nr:30S ribosomal protein S9 [Bacteroidota bacterium]MBP9881170.1 30S ribosomal protein S9 [Chitinophagales bacterium]MBK8342221.1 30S ribosomal protein S9 [Bacteroidota bacterium]MBK9505852.1 30S ribosomal protein S9 [Bacteroidota bacterium]MBK9555664.1 30S ribosomal protein S9 [Bacteroidota bacterium]